MAAKFHKADKFGTLSYEDIFKQRVCEYYSDNHTMRETADHFQISRNAVAGILHRARKLGLYNVKPASLILPANKRPEGVEKPKRIRQKPRPQLAPNVLRSAEAAKKMFKVERVRLRLIEDEKLVTLEQLKPDMCKWPIGDPLRSDFRYCGAVRVDDKCPYCYRHMQMAHRPPMPRVRHR
jgi:GcrA cell cycle regulator